MDKEEFQNAAPAKLEITVTYGGVATLRCNGVLMTFGSDITGSPAESRKIEHLVHGLMRTFSEIAGTPPSNWDYGETNMATLGGVRAGQVEKRYAG